MVIPSRWFAGGRGLDEFRERDAERSAHVATLVDFPNATRCVPRGGISGGVSYFLWDSRPRRPLRRHRPIRDGSRRRARSTAARRVRRLRPRQRGRLDPARRSLLRGEPVLRQLGSSSHAAVRAAHATSTATASAESGRRPSHALWSQKRVTGGSIGSRPEELELGRQMEGPRDAGDQVASAMKRLRTMFSGEPIVAGPGTACTETYLVAGRFESEAEAESFAAYLRTRSSASSCPCARSRRTATARRLHVRAGPSDGPRLDRRRALQQVRPDGRGDRVHRVDDPSDGRSMRCASDE